MNKILIDLNEILEVSKDERLNFREKMSILTKDDTITKFMLALYEQKKSAIEKYFDLDKLLGNIDGYRNVWEQPIFHEFLIDFIEGNYFKSIDIFKKKTLLINLVPESFWIHLYDLISQKNVSAYKYINDKDIYNNLFGEIIKRDQICTYASTLPHIKIEELSDENKNILINQLSEDKISPLYLFPIINKKQILDLLFEKSRTLSFSNFLDHFLIDNPNIKWTKSEFNQMREILINSINQSNFQELEGTLFNEEYFDVNLRRFKINYYYSVFYTKYLEKILEKKTYLKATLPNDETLNNLLKELPEKEWLKFLNLENSRKRILNKMEHEAWFLSKVLIYNIKGKYKLYKNYIHFFKSKYGKVPVVNRSVFIYLKEDPRRLKSLEKEMNKDIFEEFVIVNKLKDISYSDQENENINNYPWQNFDLVNKEYSLRKNFIKIYKKIKSLNNEMLMAKLIDNNPKYINNNIFSALIKNDVGRRVLVNHYSSLSNENKDFLVKELIKNNYKFDSILRLDNAKSIVLKKDTFRDLVKELMNKQPYQKIERIFDLRLEEEYYAILLDNLKFYVDFNFLLRCLEGDFSKELKISAINKFKKLSTHNNELPKEVILQNEGDVVKKLIKKVSLTDETIKNLLENNIEKDQISINMIRTEALLISYIQRYGFDEKVLKLLQKNDDLLNLEKSFFYTFKEEVVKELILNKVLKSNIVAYNLSNVFSLIGKYFPEKFIECLTSQLKYKEEKFLIYIFRNHKFIPNEILEKAQSQFSRKSIKKYVYLILEDIEAADFKDVNLYNLYKKFDITERISEIEEKFFIKNIDLEELEKKYLKKNKEDFLLFLIKHFYKLNLSNKSFNILSEVDNLSGDFDDIYLEKGKEVLSTTDEMIVTTDEKIQVFFNSNTKEKFISSLNNRVPRAINLNLEDINIDKKGLKYILVNEDKIYDKYNGVISNRPQGYLDIYNVFNTFLTESFPIKFGIHYFFKRKKDQKEFFDKLPIDSTNSNFDMTYKFLWNLKDDRLVSPILFGEKDLEETKRDLRVNKKNLSKINLHFSYYGLANEKKYNMEFIKSVIDMFPLILKELFSFSQNNISINFEFSKRNTYKFTIDNLDELTSPQLEKLLLFLSILTTKLNEKDPLFKEIINKMGEIEEFNKNE